MGKQVAAGGAGQVGSQVARLQAEQGHEVVLVSRSGSGPGLLGVRKVAADAADRPGNRPAIGGVALLVEASILLKGAGTERPVTRPFL